MREVAGDLWTWGDSNVAARVVRTTGLSVLTENTLPPSFTDFLRERLDKYGEHVQTFAPNEEKGRSYWIVTFPVDDERRSAAELLVWAWAMLEPDTTIVMPPTDVGIGDILDTACRFEGGEMRSIGDRFVTLNGGSA